MAHDVFISYSSKDKSVADALCARLERDGVRCWIAPRDVLPGVPYAESLTDALAASRLMVLILSAGSNQSRHVMREVESAVSRGIPIVPFRIEDVQPSKALDYYLKSIHWLDALTPPLAIHLGTLSHTVRAVLSREPAAELDEQAAVNVAMDRAASERRRPSQKLSQPLVIGGAIVAVVVLSVLVFWGVLAAIGSRPKTTQTSTGTQPIGAKTENNEKQPPAPPATEKQPGPSEPSESKTKAPAANYALRFEEDGDKVEFDDTIIKTRAEWTVEGWVMPRDPMPRTGSALVFFVDPAWLSLRNSGDLRAPGLRWAAFGPMSRPAGIAYASERAFSNRWDHVAICHGPGGLTFFVNGELQGEALPLAIHIGESRLQVCPVGNKSKGDVEFRGDIDEVRVSDIERYQGQFVPAARFEPDDHTLALYHFDDEEGEAAKDSSGHNRHGRITHATWVTSQRALDSKEQQPP